MTQKTWADGIQERVARAVKAARGTRSAQEVADETERLGYPLSRSQIANLESGRKRGLDVAELLILAAALDVPPSALLFPDLPDGEVEILPGQFVSSVAALLRFTGERDTDPQSDLGRLARLSRERFEKQVRHFAALDVVDALVERAGEDEKRQQVAADQIFRVIDSADEVRELNLRIEAIPGAVVKDESGHNHA
jgi:transcriptional regulator with XRE-family HTH domain